MIKKLLQFKTFILVLSFLLLTGFSVNQLNGFWAKQPAAGGGVASLSYIGTTLNQNNLTEYTFADHDIGTADASKLVVVGVNYRKQGTSTLSSATIDGVTATIHVDTGTTSTLRAGSAIISASVSTGSTVDIVLIFSASQSHVSVNVYRVVDLQDPDPTSAHATDSQQENEGTGVDMSVNVPADGVLVAVGTQNDKKAQSWTAGATVNDASEWAEAGATSAASETGLGVETARTVRYKLDANSDNASAVATWQ